VAEFDDEGVVRRDPAGMTTTRSMEPAVNVICCTTPGVGAIICIPVIDPPEKASIRAGWPK